MSKKTKKRPIQMKRYVVRKYIMAHSAQEALRLEKRTRPDDCWVDDEWKKENPSQLESCIGFNIPNSYDEYDE